MVETYLVLDDKFTKRTFFWFLAQTAWDTLLPFLLGFLWAWTGSFWFFAMLAVPIMANFDLLTRQIVKIKKK